MQAAQVLIAAIVSRLKDADAKAHLAAAGTYRHGKFCLMKPIADARFGKALAPREVVLVADIPKLRNAKVMRRSVRAAF